jgi:hypothetical protein
LDPLLFVNTDYPLKSSDLPGARIVHASAPSFTHVM